MVKAQLATEDMGKKRLCPSCGGRFYDLGKSPAECPYCETVFNPDEMVKGRRAFLEIGLIDQLLGLNLHDFGNDRSDFRWLGFVGRTVNLQSVTGTQNG